MANNIKPETIIKELFLQVAGTNIKLQLGTVTVENEQQLIIKGQDAVKFIFDAIDLTTSGDLIWKFCPKDEADVTTCQ